MKQNENHPESQSHLIWQRSWDRPPWDDHEQTCSTRRECLIAAKPKTSNHVYTTMENQRILPTCLDPQTTHKSLPTLSMCSQLCNYVLLFP